MKKLSKKKWALIIVSVLFLFAVFGGGDKKAPAVPHVSAADSARQAEVDKAFTIDAFSFVFPDKNAKVTFKCIKPGTKSGYNWFIESLDGKNPVGADKLYFNFQTQKGSRLASNAWREININMTGKLPAGDAFMLTAFNTRESVGAVYANYVFTVGSSIEDARNAEYAAIVPTSTVVTTSAMVMSQSPCASISK